MTEELPLAMWVVSCVRIFELHKRDPRCKLAERNIHLCFQATRLAHGLNSTAFTRLQE
jgi:hypothetical protein